VYCIGLNVIFSAESEMKFEQRVRYIFLQLVNKDSFCFTVKEWGGDNYGKKIKHLHILSSSYDS